MPNSSQDTQTPITRVSTLELFFDLVFVFVITRLTSYVVEHPSVAGVGRAALVFAVIWWMYGGYAWLTNAVTTDRVGRRITLLGGMAGFLVIALYLPLVFEGGEGVPFGIAYLAVTLVHLALFARAAEASVVQAVFRLAPLNIVTALLVLAATIVGGTATSILLGLAIITSWVITGLRSSGSFVIGAEHVVERHGLVVIVAIGESIVAIGAGVGADIDAATVATALLGLAISAALWWAYFGGDDDLAEHALSAIEPERRGRVVLYAFGPSTAAMLFGIVLLAAGIKKAIGHSLEELHGAGPWLIAGGAALFLLAEVAFRLVLRIERVGLRTVFAALLVATVPLGVHVSGLLQVSAIAAIFGLLFALEGLRAHQPR